MEASIHSLGVQGGIFMERIFGFDIGTTSIGFAVIDHEIEGSAGAILRL